LGRVQPVKFAAIATSFLIGLVTGISFVPAIAPQQNLETSIALSSQSPDVCERRCIRK
jgi:hypothetical protein